MEGVCFNSERDLKLIPQSYLFLLKVIIVAKYWGIRCEVFDLFKLLNGGASKS